MNRPLTTALVGLGIAQALKVPIHYWSTGNWRLSIAWEAGGMPSSHSAAVTSLATFVGLKKGIASIDFAVSSVFGLIVMYDAMGVRRYTGEIAIEVNELDAAVEKLASRTPGIYHRKREQRLKEMVGHMPKEVLGGCLLGVGVGFLSYILD